MGVAAEPAPGVPWVHYLTDKIESRVPAFASELGRTVACRDATSCLESLDAAVDLYAGLREAGPAAGRGPSDVEREVRAYLAGLPGRLGIERP